MELSGLGCSSSSSESKSLLGRFPILLVVLKLELGDSV